MTTDGGGWTIVNAITGADGEQPLVSDAEVGGNPLSFQHYNLNRAKKVALAAISNTSIFVRNNSTWIKANAAMFDANLSNNHVEWPVTITASNGAMDSGWMGYSNFWYSGGGDFGITNAANFDHHAPGSYYHLNSSCHSSYLYSYSAASSDDDAGYDANIGLGSWGATAGCDGNEGGSLVFYSAMR